MSDVWVVAAVPVVVAVALYGVFLSRREPLTFANDREERLTRQLAQTVGCGLAEALPAVRKELEYAPAQPDEALLKRAAYHYRREQPERGCSVWRDRAPG